MRAFLMSMVACTAVAVAGVAMIDPGAGPLRAADHFDPPGRTDATVDATPDGAGDIADIYAWYAGDKFILSLTVAGPVPTTQPAVYDRDLLYTISLSNAGDIGTAEHVIKIRFGMDGNQPGVQVTGIPGVNGAIVGPVEKLIEKDGARVEAGLRDDPFFFDAAGLRETRATGTLSIRSDRNRFGGMNITNISIDFPLDRIRNGTNKIGIWSTASRFGGQI